SEAPFGCHDPSVAARQTWFCACRALFNSKTSLGSRHTRRAKGSRRPGCSCSDDRFQACPARCRNSCQARLDSSFSCRSAHAFHNQVASGR
ncbi:MAG: hypothetical protein ACKOLA_00185, partial [Spartobacteria bacterium]